MEFGKVINATQGGSVSIIEKAVSRLDRLTTETVSSQRTPVRQATTVETMGARGVSIVADQSTRMPSTSVLENSVCSPQVKLEAAATPATFKPQCVDIDLARLQGLGMVTPEGERTSIAEEFRHIKRPLIENAFKKANPIHHGNLIMVTSALPGEGKTFCAINLAMSIAMEMDHTVLLVDADVARPSVLQHLGINADAGLMDLLLDDKLDASQVILNTNIERLRILPSGRGHRRATELLASQAMSNLLNEIANRYPDRIVIFDSPPLLLTSESSTLANQMGQIVLVVAAESTTQYGVKDALRRLGSNPNISLIYNKSMDFPGVRYYGRYY